MNFKIGDRVRVFYPEAPLHGRCGTVTQIDDSGLYPVHVKIDGMAEFERAAVYIPKELEHITE